MGETNHLETSNSLLARGLRAFNKINNVALVIAGVIMFGLMCWSVFMRYVLKSDMLAMEEYLFFFSTWAIFLGAANGTLEKSHVCGDIFATTFKSPVLLWLNEFLKQLLCWVLVVLFAYYSVLFFRNAMELPTYTTILRLNIIIGKSAVLYGAVVMAIYQTYHFVDYLRMQFHKKNDPNETLNEGGAEQ